MGQEKPKLAIYWASSCGGCEIAVVNLHERLLDVTALFDLVFCPCLLDIKRADVEAMADGEIAVTLFNGAIRTDENVEWAHLMRRKSKTLIAFGSCAYGGGIPALSNLHTRQAHFDAIYLDNPSIDNPQHLVPSPDRGSAAGPPALPAFHDRVRRLADVVEVDYSVPGCPPESDQLWNVVCALTSDHPPARGSVVGAGTSSVCDECDRTRQDKKIDEFRRVWEFVPDRQACLLEQGLLCLGLATRSGCGGLCPQVNMPCIGCYGPCDGVYDHASKLVSALGSAVDVGPLRDLRDEEVIAARVDGVFDVLPDIAGVFGRFHPPAGLRRRT